MTSDVKAVVFDIGNVLIEWQPEAHYDSVIGEERRRALFAEVDLEGMNAAVDRGANMRAGTLALAEAHPEWRDEILMWHDDWLKMVAPVIPHSVRLLRALRARGVPVFTLTNFGDANFDVAAAEYPFLTEFDRFYVSGRLKVMKPEARIYEMVEQDSGLSGAALLFADDRADNVAAARARGWQAHHFTGPAGWAERLVAEGLLSAGEAA